MQDRANGPADEHSPPHESPDASAPCVRRRATCSREPNDRAVCATHGAESILAMPALVLVAHDDAATRELAVAALNAAGVTAVGLHDPIAALDAIEGAFLVRVLVTRVDFGDGKLNGVALARMARVKRPRLKVLFLARPENREHAEAVGDCLPMPIDPHLLVDVVEKLFAAD